MSIYAEGRASVKVVFASLFLIAVSYVMGVSFRRDRDTGIALRFVTGIMVVLCALQAGTLAMRFFSCELSLVVTVLNVIFGLVCLLLLIFFRDVLFYVSSERHSFGPGTFIFIGLLLLQIGISLIAKPYIKYDMTAETVQTILSTGTVFQYNALTGAEAADYYFMPQFQVLPVFYAMICFVTGVSVRTLLYKIMPVVVLLLFYTIAGFFSRALFDTDGKRDSFLILLSVLNIFGCFSDKLLSYYLLHSAWQGDTLLFAVIFPFMLYVAVTPDRRSVGCSLFFMILGTVAGVSAAGAPLAIGLSTMLWLAWLILRIRRWRSE